MSVFTDGLDLSIKVIKVLELILIGSVSMSSKFSDELLETSRDIWRRFLPHRFLREVADNTISREAFAKWLINDYYFVKNGIRFMALILAKTPDELLSFFAESIYYISRELDMFERKAGELGIDLRSESLIDLRAKAYVNYLLTIASIGGFLENLAALYCEEKAYLEAWSWVRENLRGESPHREFINHWSSKEFREYVDKIEKLLNEYAERHGEYEKRRAREVFLEVSKYELLFWDIAYT